MNGTTATEGTHAASGSVWAEIGRSWLAMKTWVKVWLFYLNAVFLAALALVDRPLGRWALVAYLASGPLLLAMMVRQRGLTRLLGLAHLLPWIPLTVYLSGRLACDWFGPRLRFAADPWAAGYAALLLASVTICLAFDAADVVRWLRGERYVLGSPEAVRRGASKPAPVSAGRGLG